MTTKKTIRCAIYTRKSTDEGLEQEFNTLEAQREACEAYIKSQAHEGWRVIPERFDDGGHSGGTLERPAMQRLLERVRARRIDVILIYKIDRLTRSLTDFAKIAEEFDRYGVSFVSVTQQFNTTTSMGRLMLNVLLSFAQFEREIAGERIRDKIAASKKKGMWMGGTVPLGYDWKDRALVLNKAETKTVRTIFRLYLKHGNVRTVVTEAARLGLQTKTRSASMGKQTGGNRFRRGHVYAMLGNPIYVGRIPHKGQSYPASHRSIIKEKVWQQIQQKLTDNRTGRWKRSNTDAAPNLLVGILFDSKGNRFTPSHSVKSGRRYRYYIDQALVTGDKSAKSRIRRIPATEIENAVRDGFADLLNNSAKLLHALGGNIDATTSDRAIRSGQKLCQHLLRTNPSVWTTQIRPVLRRVTIDDGAIQIRGNTDSLRALLSLPLGAEPHQGRAKRQADTSEFIFVLEVRLHARGGQMKIVVGSLDNASRQPDPALVKGLAQAQEWFGQLQRRERLSINEIALKERKPASYIGRVIRLTFLAPDIQNVIIEGRSFLDLTAKRLLLRENLSHSWKTQSRELTIKASPSNSFVVSRLSRSR